MGACRQEAITARSPLLIWPRVKAVWLLCGLLAMAGCGGSSTTGFSSNPNPPPPVAGLTLLSSSNGPDPGSWEALAFDGSQTVWMGVDRAGTASVGVGEYEVLNVTDERTTRELVLSGATFTSVVQQNGTGFVDAIGSYSAGPSSGDQPAIFLLAPIQLVLRAPVITPACPNDPMRTLLQQGAAFSGMALDWHGGLSGFAERHRACCDSANRFSVRQSGLQPGSDHGRWQSE